MPELTGPSPAAHRAAQRWGLTLGAALTGWTASQVWAAVDGDGRDLVLKLPAPRPGGGGAATDEAAVLTAWRPTRASVRLVAADRDALLLARARPGASWPWAAPDLDARVEVAADLLRRLWSASPVRVPLPDAAEVLAASEQQARADARYEQQRRGDPGRGAAGLALLAAAARATIELIDSASHHTVLHGDLISKNIVSDAQAPVGWVALDPLPLRGEPALEVGAFAAYHPVEQILPVAQGLAAALGLDPYRASRWAAVLAVHQAAQAWRDDQVELETMISSRIGRRLLSNWE